MLRTHPEVSVNRVKDKEGNLYMYPSENMIRVIINEGNNAEVFHLVRREDNTIEIYVVCPEARAIAVGPEDAKSDEELHTNLY